MRDGSSYVCSSDLHEIWVRTEGQDGVRADLSDFDFTGRDLRGVNLLGALLERACLVSAQLANANLALARLNFADLRGANLSRANLRCTSYARDKLDEPDMWGPPPSAPRTTG